MSKKIIPLALCLNLLLAQPSAVFASNGTNILEEQQTEQTDQTEATTPTESPNSETATPTTYDSDNSNGDNVKNKDKADAGTTIWDGSGYTPQTCPQYAICDGAPTVGNTSDWNNILVLIGTLFGSTNTSTNNNAGYTGNDGYGTDTIGTPTIDTPTITTPTTSGDVPSGDFSTITPTGNPDGTWSDVPVGADTSGIQLGLLGGIPLGPNASYSWVRTGPGAIKVDALVYPLNPEIDTATKFGALVTSTNPSVHIYPPAQYATETYTKGGDYSKTFTFQTMEFASNSKPRYGTVTVKVNAKVYEGSTALCSSDDSSCDNGLGSGSEFDNNGNIITNTGTTTTGGNTDLGLDVGTGTNTNTGTGTGTNTGTAIDTTTDTNTGTGTGGTSEFGTNGTSTGTNAGSGSNSNLLDNIFGNGSTGSTSSTNTANGNNPDWLNDGFNNIAEKSPDSTIPSDFGNQFADNQNTAIVGEADGSITAQNPAQNVPSEQTYAAGANEGNTGDTGSYSTTPSIATNGTNETANPADSALGSIFSKIDSAIGNDPASSTSLTSKFASLTNKVSDKVEETTGFKLKSDSNNLPGSDRGSSNNTTTELKDMATRMLNANGMSQSDIKAGKQYSPGSAYTDPQDAWNLNRMSAAKAQSQIKTTNSKTTTIE